MCVRIATSDCRCVCVSHPVLGVCQNRDKTANCNISIFIFDSRLKLIRRIFIGGLRSKKSPYLLYWPIIMYNDVVNPVCKLIHHKTPGSTSNWSKNCRQKLFECLDCCVCGSGNMLILSMPRNVIIVFHNAYTFKHQIAAKYLLNRLHVFQKHERLITSKVVKKHTPKILVVTKHPTMIGLRFCEWDQNHSKHIHLGFENNLKTDFSPFGSITILCFHAPYKTDGWINCHHVADICWVANERYIYNLFESFFRFVYNRTRKRLDFDHKSESQIVPVVETILWTNRNYRLLNVLQSLLRSRNTRTRVQR